MISGHPPVRARKLRYFKDRNFTERVLPPPSPSAAGTCDAPPPHPHDWLAGLPLPTCHPVPRRAAIAGVEDEGGGLSREESVVDEDLREPRPKELEALVSLDPDFNETGEIFEPESALARAARLAPLDPDDGLPL